MFVTYVYTSKQYRHLTLNILMLHAPKSLNQRKCYRPVLTEHEIKSLSTASSWDYYIEINK